MNEIIYFQKIGFDTTENERIKVCWYLPTRPGQGHNSREKAAWQSSSHMTSSQSGAPVSRRGASVSWRRSKTVSAMSARSPTIASASPART